MKKYIISTINEEWRDIKGFIGLYMVSNTGRVKSLDRDNVDVLGIKRRLKGKILSQRLNRDGYYKVSLSKQCKSKSYFAHRLVSFAFIDNPCNKKEVNHINGIKTDNRVENLEWVTPKENVRHAFDTGLISIGSGKDSPNAKPVVQISLSGIIIKKYGSVSDAYKETGIGQDSISNAARGCSKTAGGFIWYYSSELANKTVDGVLINIINHTEYANCKPIGQFDLDGNLLREFRSIKQAIETVHTASPSGISSCINGRYKTCGGFKWMLL